MRHIFQSTLSYSFLFYTRALELSAKLAPYHSDTVYLELKKFLRGRIEDLRLETKIRENLCRFCLLRKDFVSKFDEVPTLNYYCYLYYFGLGKLYDWGQIIDPI
ncbi:hypothetical protein PHYBLDRAFT_166719 [Phycomyces blakesleeanus NRRL 1555(-)]|uniref:Uncharacterized protein n=1 Tax=Phycomyces blakesleeanus (strain ATCC 8743b / DSM 1359 / FGSC 10004 / NBRC 33097 / NRRL 1555) TaxID=763407 RepID=A0A162UII8_PHYB8|nr:hypothetical protein PHYBLDRAFT_166719 [Phycomyces blakesleeanus NRRL 1555(-)]OAD75483.1 hypothetical protein PHYBLDRAFT_166719 [Phycomyces blakesleeanus NRRL 1555(-)]|eukprot:XP_018293523.1 hypothetical protein PHYBLDRAFT_166719 [Phycomyces blakesleeanus NRRL 1555(-)]